MQHSKAKSLSKLILKEFSTSNSSLTQTVTSANQASQVATAAEKVLNSKSDKHGAVAVFAALLCILIFSIQAILAIGCVIAKVTIHLKNLFGSYNPEYDLLYRLNSLAQQRKLNIAGA